MHPVLSLTLQSMQSDMRRMDRIAMNLANAQTPGYKREVAGDAFAQTLLESQGAAAIHLDQRQGAMKPSGQNLDLALTGPGWFEVMTEQGPAYTRLGSFRRDPQGRLVTEQGQLVAGIAGEIHLPEGPVSVDAEGRIYEAVAGEGGVAKSRSEPVAQLKVVAFEENVPARRLGNGLVNFPGATVKVPAATEIHQGYLENANVSSMQEMVQLMQTVRHFESLQKAALGYDEMLGNAIRKLGDGQ